MFANGLAGSASRMTPKGTKGAMIAAGLRPAWLSSVPPAGLSAGGRDVHRWVGSKSGASTVAAQGSHGAPFSSHWRKPASAPKGGPCKAPCLESLSASSFAKRPQCPGT